MSKVISTREAALEIFGNEKVGTRQRIVRMVRSGWLTGHQLESTHNSPYWVSIISVERYIAAIEQGGAAIARLKDVAHADDAA